MQVPVAAVVTSEQAAPPLSRGLGLARALRLAGLLQFALLPLLFLLLPLTAVQGAPVHDLLGGMFIELTPPQVFLVALPLFFLTWSTMATLGLILEGSRLDPPRDLPGWVGVLDLPPRLGTFFAYPLLALPGLGVMIAKSAAPLAATATGLAAAVVAYLGAVLLAGAFTAVDPDYDPLPDPLAVWIAQRLASSDALKRAVGRALRLASWLTRPPVDGAWDPEKRAMAMDHFVAAGFCASTFLVFLVEAWVFRPWTVAKTTLPAAALVLTLGTVLVWVFGALSFHLRRYRLSPLLVVVVLAVLGYTFLGYDHHFQARTIHAPPLAPAEVAAPVKDGNLVVVTTTGGGILAAGWTTLALQELIHARPELRDEIRLVSGASGGSVGAAFYLAGLRKLGEPGQTVQAALAEARARSMASSLDAVAYGLVFLDFPRLFSGGFLFSATGNDRGYLLEKRWSNLAGGLAVSVHELAPEIRAGRLPAPIFNLTAMETGRRVMATPVTFSGNGHRAETLDEYLLPQPAPSSGGEVAGAAVAKADLDMWTAARLSATFPYVSPAARALIDNRFGEDQASHHMIDGGYNDNYGVASALDFLDPVMNARLDGKLSFKRLLIIQLRCSNVDSAPPSSAPGIQASLVGPLLGILNVRDGATLPRNEAALQQFIELWDTVGGVRVQTLVFQPAPRLRAGGIENEEPLSWHLTEAQKAAIGRRWSGQPGLAKNLAAMRAFLETGAAPP
jgi:hypothetical protein